LRYRYSRHNFGPLRVVRDGGAELPINITSPNTASPIIHAMLVSLTVGKVDAGVAVLLTEDKRLVCA
jgi:hypothetical protein